MDSLPQVPGQDDVYTCLDQCLKWWSIVAWGSPVGLCRTTKRKGLSMMISSGAIRAEMVMAEREGTMS